LVEAPCSGATCAPRSPAAALCTLVLAFLLIVVLPFLREIHAPRFITPVARNIKRKELLDRAKAPGQVHSDKNTHVRLC
jgi:hypothetical protein